MRTNHALAVGCFLGLLAGAALLVSLPRTSLPCEVLVSYQGKRFKATGYKLQFQVIDVVKQKVLKGTGSFGPSSLSCVIDLTRTQPI